MNNVVPNEKWFFDKVPVKPHFFPYKNIWYILTQQTLH
jgi:hypothetical protein